MYRRDSKAWGGRDDDEVLCEAKLTRKDAEPSTGSVNRHGSSCINETRAAERCSGGRLAIRFDLRQSIAIKSGRQQ
jgi:hypothetical protein